MHSDRNSRKTRIALRKIDYNNLIGIEVFKASMMFKDVLKMRTSEEQQKLDEIISVLSENRLKEVIDFASYLRTKEETEERLGMQISSKGYIDWSSSENNIYDEVFRDEIKKR